VTTTDKAKHKHAFPFRKKIVILSTVKLICPSTIGTDLVTRSLCQSAGI